MAAKRTRRKKAAYRKKVQNRFSMFLVMLALLMILVAVYASSIKLQEICSFLSGMGRLVPTHRLMGVPRL